MELPVCMSRLRMTRTALTALWAISLAWPLLGGCSGPQWEWDFREGKRKAAASNRPIFLYFNDWMDPTSARMQNEVLRTPEGRELLLDTVNIWVEVGIQREIAEQYHIRRAPAYVVAKPNGDPVDRYPGIPTLDAFVSRVTRAKQRAVPTPATTTSSTAITP
jgi:hypothetical protein